MMGIEIENVQAELKQSRVNRKRRGGERSRTAFPLTTTMSKASQPELKKVSLSAASALSMLIPLHP